MTLPTPINYTSRDFNSLITDLRVLAPQLLPEWTDTSDNDFGKILLDLYAYVGDINNYYIDRVINEAFLSTATLRSSVINIANMLGYTPISLTSATTLLVFSTANGSGSITIPAGTQVSTIPLLGENPVLFETDSDLTIVGNTVATPQYVGSVTATQGVTISAELVTTNATGGANQSYSLFNPLVIENSIVVTITDPVGVTLLWTQVDTLLNASANSRVYSVALDDNDVTTIQFGDNIAGHAPSAGSTISVTYRVGVGADGNVAANQLVELVTVVNGVTAVTNPSSANGGTDSESIDSMRKSIPQSLTALQRAVTLADYKALAIQVPGVAKASALAVVYTSVGVYVAPVGGGLPSAALKQDVHDYFDDKQLVNVSVTMLDPTYVGVNITATVHVLPNYYQLSVKTAVLNSLENLVLFENVDFGQSITVSQIYHAIQSTEGVDYATLTTAVRADAATPTGVQDIAISVNEIPEKGTFVLNMVGGVT